ncbi:MAG: hypothetical protein ACFFE8_00950 [Candidatus Heimdallarchaeota archaeon]
MVKLFRRKTDKTQRDFRFDTSLKLRDLPLEEYAHVVYAFQVNALRFEHMLKESLLEGHITSTTLEKVSREFQFEQIRDLDIPTFDSVTRLFGGKSKETPREREVPPSEPLQPAPVPEPTPSPSIPRAAAPETKISPSTTSTPATSRPEISFSFPETPPISKPTTPSPTPSSPPSSLSKPPMPEKQHLSPSIPKISFPGVTKPTPPSPVSPLKSSKRSAGEEDRATGIAILRKQMLSELKKIRSVVSEEK